MTKNFIIKKIVSIQQVHVLAQYGIQCWNHLRGLKILNDLSAFNKKQQKYTSNFTKNETASER